MRKAPVSFSSPGRSPPWVQPTAVQTHSARSAPELSPGCSMPFPATSLTCCAGRPLRSRPSISVQVGDNLKSAPRAAAADCTNRPAVPSPGCGGKPSPRRRASALAALRPGPPEDDGDPRALKRPSATAGFKRGRGLGVWWAGSEQRAGLGGRGLKEETLPGWAGQARGEGGRAGFSWGRGLSRWAGWRAQARVFHVGLR